VANETGAQTPADDPALARPIGWWPSGEADVAEALAAFDPPSVIHEILAQLTSSGWVTEVDDALRLTEEGTRVHAAIAPLVDQVREQVSTALPPDDYVTLVRLLQRLTAAL
jgi:hypothetical protein